MWLSGLAHSGSLAACSRSRWAEVSSEGFTGDEAFLAHSRLLGRTLPPRAQFLAGFQQGRAILGPL